MATWLVSSCAYVLSTDSQNISISTNPAGASVTIRTTGGIEVYNGTTPATAHLKRKNEYIIDISLPGHTPSQAYLEQSINPATLWNLLIGGIYGWIVDGVLEAIWKLEPKTIMITLQTVTIEGQERDVLVFSWLNEAGEEVLQAAMLS